MAEHVSSMKTERWPVPRSWPSTSERRCRFVVKALEMAGQAMVVAIMIMMAVAVVIMRAVAVVIRPQRTARGGGYLNL